MEGGYLWHSVIPEKAISSVRFGPLSNKVLITSRGNAIFGFTVCDKRRPVAYKAKKFTPTVGIYNSDGSNVIGGSLEGKIGLWPTHGLTAKKITVAHSSGINDIAYSPTVNVVITASNDQTIKLWTQELEFITTVKIHKSQVTALAASSNSSFVVSGDSLGHIILWDLNDLKSEPVWNKSLKVGKRTSIVSLSFDSTGSFLAAATSDGHISVWNIPNGELIQAYEENTSCVTFSPTKPYLLVSCADCVQKIYSLQSSSLLFSFEGHKAPGIGAAWDPSGERFVTADRDGIVIGWDIPKYEYKPIWVSKNGQECQVNEIKEQKKAVKEPKKAVKKEKVNESKPVEQQDATTLLLEKLLPQIDMLSSSMKELSQRCCAQEERLNKLMENSK